MDSDLTYAEDGYIVNGTFEMWEVADGSADTLMNLGLTFAHCDLTQPDGSDLSQFMAAIVVQVSLELLPVTPPGAPTGFVRGYHPPPVTQLSFRPQQIGAADWAPIPPCP